nr:hypothetical protein [Tanacetum cinerariifolium]
MQGSTLSVVDMETQFNNEFDQFIVELGESLVSFYNHFSQLMNDLKRNKIKLPIVTINTKFLNCLQPKWIKYVTSVHLAKDLTTDLYDDLFDYLQQYEKIFIASRAKKLEKTHDTLALVAHTSSSSQSPPAYYVTRPPSVVDYDDDYQEEIFQNDLEDFLTIAMMLLACAITQCYSTPTNNRLRSSSNIRSSSSEDLSDIDIETLTLEQYLALNRNNSQVGVKKPEIEKSIIFEIKSQLLKVLHDNTLSRGKTEDAMEHFRNILEIASLLNIPRILGNDIMLRISLYSYMSCQEVARQNSI